MTSTCKTRQVKGQACLIGLLRRQRDTGGCGQRVKGRSTKVLFPRDLTPHLGEGGTTTKRLDAQVL